MAIHRRTRNSERLPVGAAAGLCALLASVPASAQASLDQRYPDGFALNVFEPSPAGDRFFSAPDISSYPDGRVRLGLVGDIATGSRPVLTRTDNVTGQSAAVVSSQVYVHAGVAYPLTDFLHAHADVPLAAAQNGDTASSPKGGQLGDIRIGLRANIVSPRVEAVAFGPGVDLWLPTGSEDNLTGDGALRVNPRLGMSGRIGAFVYTANGGYLVRKKVSTGSLELGDALTFSGGAGVMLFHDVLQVGPEIWGNGQVHPAGSGGIVTPTSGLIGAKVQVGDFSLGAAGGVGLTDAPGVGPRVLLNVALAPPTHVEVQAPAPIEKAPPVEAPPVVEAPPPVEAPPAPVVAEKTDRDHDDVADADDACPDRAGVASSDQAKNGCPAAPVAPVAEQLAAPVDGDGDGIPDAKDACPDKLGDPSPDPKLNGCPRPRIADADGDGVRDELDACPDVKGEPSRDKKKNGCPPPVDTDGDGVLDGDDACPHDAGPRTRDPKANGCPKPVAPVAPAHAKPAGEGAEVTFSGFHVFEDGTSRIFVQLTAAVDVEASVVGKRAEYLLRGARIPSRNNENPLMTQHFIAEVVSARLVPSGTATKGGKAAKGKHARRARKGEPSDVRLVVEMRESAKPQHRVVRNADGTATLVVDFPKPVNAPPPEADPVPPPSKPPTSAR